MVNFDYGDEDLTTILTATYPKYGLWKRTFVVFPRRSIHGNRVWGSCYRRERMDAPKFPFDKDDAVYEYETAQERMMDEL